MNFAVLNPEKVTRRLRDIETLVKIGSTERAKQQLENLKLACQNGNAPVMDDPNGLLPWKHRIEAIEKSIKA